MNPGVDTFLKSASKVKAKQPIILEADIENPFVKYAKTKKYTALKLVFLRKRGFPDRTVLGPNKTIFFIEFKQLGKNLSPIQTLVRKTIEGFGFEYYVCDKIGQAEAILDTYLDDTLDT